MQLFNMEREDICCNIFRLVDTRKRSIRCSQCDRYFHLSCVGLTMAQADNISVGLCDDCRGRPVGPDRKSEPLLLDHVNYISGYRSEMKVLAMIPKGVIVLVAETLKQHGLRAWARLMSFTSWSPAAQ